MSSLLFLKIKDNVSCFNFPNSKHKIGQILWHCNYRPVGCFCYSSYIDNWVLNAFVHQEQIQNSNVTSLNSNVISISLAFSMVQALCNISELSWPSLSWTLYIIDMKTNLGEKHILIVSHPTIMMLFQFNIKNIKHSSHNHNQKIKNAKWDKPSSSSLPKYHTG